MYEQQRKKGRPLTGTERNLIEHLYKLGFTQTAIAKEVGVWPSTICRELRRGMVDQLNGDTWEYYRIYSPQKAQSRADYMKSAHGPDLKIGNRVDYLAALEAHILTGSSPQDAIAKVGNDYGVTISKATVSHANVSHPKHRSIEHRAKSIRNREEVGHWELDSVIGKAEGTGESCLVMTDRKTRGEIIIKARSKTAADTVHALQWLKCQIGRDWKLIFHTITNDNGSEFADQDGIDALGVTTFYCHPQSPHERGTNEVTNKLVRRKLPKGKSMAKVTQKQATEVQHWVNHYTRPMFGGKSAADMLKEELDKLPLYNREKVYRFFDLL